jgi:hypothetical protein
VNLYDSNQNCGVGSQKSKGVGLKIEEEVEDKKFEDHL